MFCALGWPWQRDRRAVTCRQDGSPLPLLPRRTSVGNARQFSMRRNCFPIPLCAYAEALALLAGNGWTSAGLISHLPAGSSLSRAPWLDEDGSQCQRMVGSRYLDRDLIAVDAGHFAAQHDGITHFHFRRHDRPPGSIEAAAWFEGNSAFRQNHMLRDIGQGQGKRQGRGDSYHQHGLRSVTKRRSAL